MSQPKLTLASVLALYGSGELGAAWWMYEPQPRQQRSLLFKYPTQADKDEELDLTTGAEQLQKKAHMIYSASPQAVLLMQFHPARNGKEEERYTVRVVGPQYVDTLDSAATLAGVPQQPAVPVGMLPKETIEQHLALQSAQYDLKLQNAIAQLEVKQAQAKLDEQKRELAELRKKYESRVESTKQALSDGFEPLLQVAGAWAKNTFAPSTEVAPALAGLPEDSFAAQTAVYLNELDLNPTEEDVVTTFLNQAIDRIEQMRRNRAGLPGQPGRPANHSRQPDPAAAEEAGWGGEEPDNA